MLLQFVELFQAHHAKLKKEFGEKPQLFPSPLLHISGEHSDLVPLK